ncbi:MAG: MFS transporter [Comamonas sp.]
MSQTAAATAATSAAPSSTASASVAPAAAGGAPPQAPMIYLRRPPDWEEHEKPSLPGSPAMPFHKPWVRVCYGLIAVLIALTGGLGNALFTANLPTIQGQMGLTVTEAAWLSGAYVMFNVTANLLVYKFRQQFGMRLFAEIGLGVYAALCVLHLLLGGYDSLILLRAASGLAAATCSSLGTLYMLQAAPRTYVLKMLVIGVGVGQLAAPLAWVLSPGLLYNSDWHNLYMFEAGLALLSFAAVVVLKLPPGVFIKTFEKLDFLTMALMVPGLGLLIAVLVQGYSHWWLDTPWLAWMLVGSIVLLSTALYIEHHRLNPMLHTRWFTQAPTIRFVVGAILLRFLTTEQTYGMVGLLRTLGMTPDQMQPLFWVILLGTLVGIAVSASTFGLPHLGKQILGAIALFAVAAFLDLHRTSLDRPADFFLSQFLLAIGAGIFMGPLMLTGVIQGLKYGPNHMLTAIVTISMTQAMGGLMGSALLSTYQLHREQVYSVALVAQLDPTDPVVAERLKIQNQIYGRVTPDPAVRANQGLLQLSQIVRREANVRAYNDVFALTAAIAVAYLLWLLGVVERLRKAAALVRALTWQSGNQGAAAAATDGAPQRASSLSSQAADRSQSAVNEAQPQAAAGGQPRFTVVVEESQTDARGDDLAGYAQVPGQTLVIEGEQALELSQAAQAAQLQEAAVLASRDPLQDNEPALALKERLEAGIGQAAKEKAAQEQASQAALPTVAEPDSTQDAQAKPARKPD